MLIDHQPQMTFSVQSHDIANLRNNLAGLSKTAKLFSIPIIMTQLPQQLSAVKFYPKSNQSFLTESQLIERLLTLGKIQEYLDKSTNMENVN